MKKSKKTFLKAIKKLAEIEADMKNIGWPPDCPYGLYQMQRPEKLKEKREE